MDFGALVSFGGAGVLVGALDADGAVLADEVVVLDGDAAGFFAGVDGDGGDLVGGGFDDVPGDKVVGGGGAERGSGGVLGGLYVGCGFLTLLCFGGA